MHGIFITATNTNRGKTLITAALRLWLQQQGQNCLAMKPVQTGMEQHQVSPDLYSIYALDYPNPNQQQVYQDLKPLLPLLQPYCYSQPCSPHLAAEIDHLPSPDIGHIQDCAQSLVQQKHCDILLIEGAGGLYVPLDRKAKTNMANLAKRLGLPILLVAQSGLGAINDTCLSLTALKQVGLPIIGFLLNDLSSEAGPEYIRADNPKIIEQLTGITYLGTLPYLANPKDKSQMLNAFQNLSGLEQFLIG